MAEYEVVFARSASKELESLDDRVAVRILNRIEKLGADPRPSGVRKLRGSTNLWRLRIGEYRVVYIVDDPGKLVDIVAVRHRSDVYR